MSSTITASSNGRYRMDTKNNNRARASVKRRANRIATHRKPAPRINAIARYSGPVRFSTNGERLIGSSPG